jgi:hypothetical protein
MTKGMDALLMWYVTNGRGKRGGRKKRWEEREIGYIARIRGRVINFCLFVFCFILFLIKWRCIKTKVDVDVNLYFLCGKKHKYRRRE